MKKTLLPALIATTVLSGVYADGMPVPPQSPSDAGFRFEVGLLGGGSITKASATVKSPVDTYPDSKKDIALTGGHGGVFLTAGYQFASGLVLGVCAEGSVTNDIGHDRVNWSSGVTVPVDTKARRTYTYGGSLFFGKTVGKATPYFKAGYRQHGFKITTALQNSADVGVNKVKLGSVMTGFGCNFDVSSGLFVGAETDVSLGKEKKYVVPNPIGMSNRFKPSVLQVSFKLGYRI